MGKRLERFGEVRIIDETNGFGLDFVEKTESRFWSTNLLVSSILINACAVQMGAGPLPTWFHLQAMQPILGCF